jgi:hypothetical protein
MRGDAMETNPPATMLIAPTSSDLEMENARLQRLVADLLMRNQQLRTELKLAQRPQNL